MTYMIDNINIILHGYYGYYKTFCFVELNQLITTSNGVPLKRQWSPKGGRREGNIFIAEWLW